MPQAHVPFHYLSQSSEFLVQADQYRQIHPGVYRTGMFSQWVRDLGYPEDSPSDDLSLAGDFCIWLTSSESDFLKGRYLAATFDVDELLERKAEFEKDPTLLRITWAGTFL
jgi:hypothetical protein